jgi:hypothetical protein
MAKLKLQTAVKEVEHWRAIDIQTSLHLMFQEALILNRDILTIDGHRKMRK